MLSIVHDPEQIGLIFRTFTPVAREAIHVKLNSAVGYKYDAVPKNG